MVFFGELSIDSLVLQAASVWPEAGDLVVGEDLLSGRRRVKMRRMRGFSEATLSSEQTVRKSQSAGKVVPTATEIGCGPSACDDGPSCLASRSAP